MIQKISFNGNYKFGYSRQYGCHQSLATATGVLTGACHKLKNGDKVTISKNQNGDFVLSVPDYMDKEIEKYCYYSATSYEKLDN